jgi:hypothetical protein
MNTWLRTTGTALTAGAIAVTACGGSTAGPGGGSSSSCDRYFTTLYTTCQNPQPPASEVSRVRARFDKLCAEALALPGISITANSLDACISAVQSSGCNATSQPACKFGPGALADGSKCVSNEQCMSDTCSAGQQASDGGVMLCGTCVAGTPCGSAVCPANTICTTNGTSGSCQPIVFGDSGATCDDVVSQCKPGLVCNEVSRTCAAPGAAGSPCRAPTDCGGSLACPVSTSGATSTCQAPGSSGAACQSDNDCAAGLGCNYVARTCGAVTWATAGQPCGPTSRCLVGFCPLNGNATSGTCPTVIADGQPCSMTDPTQTCDTLSECYGTCQIAGTNNCP